MKINLPLLLRSYVIVGRWSSIPIRLLIVSIGILLGLTSLSILYSFQVLEGIILFVFFFISGYLIDSFFNINARKSQRISSSINIFSRSGFMGILAIHIIITIILAFHLSFVLNRIPILALTIVGLAIIALGSIKTTTTQVKASSAPTTGISTLSMSIGMVFLPMTSGYFIVTDILTIYPIMIIIGITVVFCGISIFEQLNHGTNSNMAGEPTRNSVEWEAVQVANELGLENAKIKNVAVELQNIRNEAEYVNTPMDERILFLPHCLRVADRCKAKYNDKGLICRHCTKDCNVNLITTEAERLGYKCFVVPGGSMVFNIAKKYKPKGVLAVACFNELKEGAARTTGDYNVPFQLVPLLKDGCVNTKVDIEKVNEILKMGTRGSTHSAS